MKEKELSRLSLWLLPIEADSSVLEEQMDQLSKTYDAPRFIPHVTVFSVQLPRGEVNNVKNQLRLLAESMQPFTLSVEGIHGEDDLFKAIVLDLGDDVQLQEIYRGAREILGQFGDYNLTTHLSLLYKILSPDAKQQIISNLKVPQSITFNRLGVIVHQNEQVRLDINNWKVEIL